MKKEKNEEKEQEKKKRGGGGGLKTIQRIRKEREKIKKTKRLRKQ